MTIKHYWFNQAVEEAFSSSDGFCDTSSLSESRDDGSSIAECFAVDAS